MPDVRKAHQDAMATYLRLAPFFKTGRFYGLDEMTHLHVHPAKPAAVINCFNLETHAVEREVEFIPEKYGLNGERSYQFKGVRSRSTGKGYTMIFRVPALGHKLTEIEAI
jgi:hypothetical protein